MGKVIKEVIEEVFNSTVDEIMESALKIYIESFTVPGSDDWEYRFLIGNDGWFESGQILKGNKIMNCRDGKAIELFSIPAKQDINLVLDESFDSLFGTALLTLNYKYATALTSEIERIDREHIDESEIGIEQLKIQVIKDNFPEVLTENDIASITKFWNKSIKSGLLRSAKNKIDTHNYN